MTVRDWLILPSLWMCVTGSDWLSSRTTLPSLWMCVNCEGLAEQQDNPTFSVDVCDCEGLADPTFSVDVCDWE